MSVKLSRYIFRRINGRIIPIRKGTDAVADSSNFSMSALRKLQGKMNKAKKEIISKFTSDSIVKHKVFHGSNSTYDKFDHSKIGSATGTGGAGRGFYFTSSKVNASGYGKNVKEYFLKIKKPLVRTEDYSDKRITKKSIEKLIDMHEDKVDALSNYGWVPDEGLSTVKNRAINMIHGSSRDSIDAVNDMSHSMYHNDTKTFFKNLRKATGFDGVVDNIDEGKAGYKHFIAYNTDQILEAPKMSTIYKDAIKAQYTVVNHVRGKLWTGFSDIWKKKGVDSFVYENNQGLVKLATLKVEKDLRGTGIGTQFMNALTKKIDRMKKDSVLYAYPLMDNVNKSPTKNRIDRLKRFYKKFGYQRNFGKNRDYRYNENMIRRQKKK